MHRVFSRIPDSDVVVGQSQDNLSVWYNIDHPESCDIKAIKGDVVEISKDPSTNRTYVKLNDNGVQSTLELDSNKIEFNTAINDQNFRRAVAYLDACGSSDETSNALWETLARLAYEKQEYVVAEQAYTATRQMAKARFLHSINRLIREERWFLRSLRSPSEIGHLRTTIKNSRIDLFGE